MNGTSSTRRTYLRVTPTSEHLETDRLPRAIESLHKLSSTESRGFLQKLNPLSSKAPHRFEFLVLCEGRDDPVEFYYGVDGCLDTLETRLRSVYPETFDIERQKLDVASRLIQPVEFTKAEFAARYEAGEIQHPVSNGDTLDTNTDSSSTAEPGESTSWDSGHLGSASQEHTIEVGGTELGLAPPPEASTEEVRRRIERPTATGKGTILARPTLDAVSPVGVQWSGSATRRRDWMTSLRQFGSAHSNETGSAADQPSSMLASLVDYLMEATAPVVFQVVFQRRASWEAKADVRKREIIDGRDTIGQQFLATLLDSGRRRRTEEALSDSAVGNRIDSIEEKNPRRSFIANIRTVGIPTEDTEREEFTSQLDSLCSVFDPLDGPYYKVEGELLRSSGFRNMSKGENAHRSLECVLNRELTTGRKKTRPNLVLSGGELANFVHVPSAAQLTVEGRRGTRAEQQGRNPLPAPDPDLLDQFDTGMAIGHALDANGTPRCEPLRIPPRLLTMHYGRFASTGGGKSKAIINDALSLRASTGGPVVLIDPKGDGMCTNYLRCHYERFDLSDVYHFRVPDTLPAISFFDIRPALDAGRNRVDAIQDKVAHFHDIMRMVMGRDQYERAFVALEILSNLIKALFDAEYGGDAFGLDELFEAALRMQRERTIPPVAIDNQVVEESLTWHFTKDDRQFQVSMDAVGNRLDKLSEDSHLREIFTHVPERDETGEYIDNRFDFRTVLDADVTILFDLGDLRPEAQRAMTLLLLSNLWDAVQTRRREGTTGYENLTNLIIEEAAPIASTKLVSEQLLPQGRSFGLSLGLVMQFPKQVRHRSERAYDEVLSNIKTKFIGNVSIERDLAESLAHEDLSPTDLRNRINTLPNGEWIAQLPSPTFGETGPVPCSLKPLPIATGHPESDEPLSKEHAEKFEATALPRVNERTRTRYGLTDNRGGQDTVENEGWGSRQPVDEADPGESVRSEKPRHSSFIWQPLSDSTTDEEGGKDAEATDSLCGPGGSERPEASNTTHQKTDSELTGSSPVPPGGITVSDDELRRRGLTRDDARFLSCVLEIMNGEVRDYTLFDSMRPLQDVYEDADVQRLVEQELLEEAQTCGRSYYTLLPAGRELLDKKLSVGPGEGDLGEKTPHKVGVKLLERWMETQADVTLVQPYYEYDRQTVFDVAGFDAEGELTWVGEVEFPSNNTHAAVSDYDKMEAVEANAVWAFDTRETAIDVLGRLADADRLPSGVSGRTARTLSGIRDTVEAFDVQGMTTMCSLNEIDTELNP